MPRWLRVAAMASALVATPTAANANGRFPNATQLVASPADPKHFLLRTTYGVIQSFDGGTTWALSCERAVGYSGVFDPAFAISGTGRILSGLLDGIATSSDSGCDWQRVPLLAGRYVIDLAVDATNPLRVVGVTAGTDAARAVLVESLDGGAAWAVVAELDSDVRPETIDVAPISSAVWRRSSPRWIRLTPSACTSGSTSTTRRTVGPRAITL